MRSGPPIRGGAPERSRGQLLELTTQEEPCVGPDHLTASGSAMNSRASLTIRSQSPGLLGMASPAVRYGPSWARRCHTASSSSVTWSPRRPGPLASKGATRAAQSCGWRSDARSSFVRTVGSPKPPRIFSLRYSVVARTEPGRCSIAFPKSFPLDGDSLPCLSDVPPHRRRQPSTLADEGNVSVWSRTGVGARLLDIRFIVCVMWIYVAWRAA